MRPVLVIGGVLLTLISIPFYYYSPNVLTNTARSFVGSLSAGNTMSGASMLRQMGYPPLHVVIPMFQYMLIGLAIMGIGFAAFGAVAKNIPKRKSVKTITSKLGEESDSLREENDARSVKNSEKNKRNDQASFDVMNNVLTKLETDLMDIKTGYEDHRQQIEDEKKKLEQKERERKAKTIAAGEVLIKEITPDQFEERINYYVGLKSKETGQPIDLSLLAEKFESMKERLESKGNNYSHREFGYFKKFLD